MLNDRVQSDGLERILAACAMSKTNNFWHTSLIGVVTWFKICAHCEKCHCTVEIFKTWVGELSSYPNPSSRIQLCNDNHLTWRILYFSVCVLTCHCTACRLPLNRAQVAKLLPPSLVHMSTPDEWVSAVGQAWNKSVKGLTVDKAKLMYLSKWIYLVMLHFNSLAWLVLQILCLSCV